MGWWKCEDGIRNSGKVALAGEDGAVVYFMLLCLHNAFGSGGRIPEGHCRPEIMRIECVSFLGRWREPRIAKALEACVAAQLVRMDGGDVVIAGMSEKHLPECSRCHQPNPEPRYGNCPTCRDQKTAARRAKASRAGEGRERAVPSLPEGQSGPELVAASLPDRKGREGKGQDMDGRMDGLSRTRNQNGEGYGTRSPAQAGDVAANVLRAVTP